MAAPVGGVYRVAWVINQAIGKGCELVVSKTFRIVTPDGTESIRYLHNPQTGGRFPLNCYADNEYMTKSTIENIERRLSIRLLG